MKPIDNGSKAAIVVHFQLPVSLKMVYSVVLHGLCIKLKIIRFTAVSRVQPPAVKSIIVSVAPASNITPAPPPKSCMLAAVSAVNIKMVGITISLAGMATI